MTDIDDDYLTSFVTPSGRHFQLLFGDYDSACIFIASDTLHDVGILSFSVDDLAWALHRRMVDLNVKTLLFDAMAPWLAQFHYALSCLQSFPGPVISIRTLRQNAQNAKWATAWSRLTVQGAGIKPTGGDLGGRRLATVAMLALNPWTIPVKESFSILAYFLSGCDIGQDELHDNTAGISFGNSLYVPSEVSCQPCPRLYPQRALV
jgi:hypothetical protein